jgi:lysophospholipid acyltransferase (LPLAT)-like uncharacterized protein
VRRRDDLRFGLAGILGRLLVGGLFTTTRCVRRGQEHYLQFRRKGEPVVFAFWHGHLLPLVHYHRNEGIVVLVSEHGDGEYITRIIHRHGFGAARGSSTRGGARGLRGLVRAARAGRDLALTPDGPRGPRQEFKWGALVAAQLTERPIIPLAVAATRAWHLGSWDRFMIPKPFATIRIVYGPPVWIPRGAGSEDLVALARDLEGELGRLLRVAVGDDVGDSGS